MSLVRRRDGACNPVCHELDGDRDSCWQSKHDGARCQHSNQVPPARLQSTGEPDTGNGVRLAAVLDPS